MDRQEGQLKYLCARTEAMCHLQGATAQQRGKGLIPIIGAALRGPARDGVWQGIHRAAAGMAGGQKGQAQPGRRFGGIAAQ
jgi:hypothetical protein